jgi:hypothetical protein
MAGETTVLPLWGVCCTRFQVRRVDDQQLELAFQQGIDRPPPVPPVDAIATGVQSAAASQGANSTNAAVVVRKVRTFFGTCP